MADHDTVKKICDMMYPHVGTPMPIDQNPVSRQAYPGSPRQGACPDKILTPIGGGRPSSDEAKIEVLTSALIFTDGRFDSHQSRAAKMLKILEVDGWIITR